VTGALSGRVAVVSGGSRGIGRGVAESLLKRGANVMIAARTGPEIERAVDELRDLGSIAGRQCDVTDSAAVDELVARTSSEFGRLDIAVCTAGIFEGRRPLLDYPEDVWDQVIAVNLKGAFLLAQASAREMVRCATDAGRIVLISSVDALASEPNCVGYNASKAALHGLARSIAVDLAAHRITCNVIAPGWVATPMLSSSIPQPVLDREAPFALTLDGRIGWPQDIGEPVAWLAEPSSQYVNGAVIVVDGGQTARAAMPYSSAPSAP
jgi:NAD(P)-dependent dehydrogenase (short-subunit alcohol dehydrogenase family)